MRRFWHPLIFSWMLFFFGGCVIVGESLDYRNDLSDYEAKKIVKKIFLSQQSLSQAALLSSSGFSTLVHTQYDPYQSRYACQEGGYFTFQLTEHDFSFTMHTGDQLFLDYYECTFAPYFYPPARLHGTISLIYYQNMEDYRNKLLNFSVTYAHTYLDSPYGNRYLDGTIGIHYDEDFDRHLLKLTLSSNRFTIAETTYHEDRFENVVLDFTLDTYSERYTYSYSGTLYTPYLGRLSFSTLLPLQGYGTAHPYRGELKITNAHMSLIVRPIDDYYVDIEVNNHYYPSQNRIIRTTWINIGLS